jgi:hypothetical protein
MHLAYFIFICILIILQPCLTTSPLKCKKQSDCAPVTDNIGYVTCKNSRCQCRYWNGFKGDANKNSKCTCSLNVVYVENTKYCINLTRALLIDKQLVFQEKNKQTVKSIATDLTPSKIHASMANLYDNKLPDYMTKNIQGRVEQLGDYSGARGLAEYFYSSIYASGMNITQLNYVYLIAEGNQVHFRLDLVFTIPNMITSPTNLTQTGWYRFNSAGKVESMYISILQFGLLMDNASTHMQRVEQICGVALTFCHGNNTQYNSFEECAKFLATLPEGTYYRANSNSVVCRQFHSYLATSDPATHCPHIGPTGGMKCIDFSYSSYYEKYI